ncbi:hypothetical protein B484DRAFT_394585 [Ochromonadaceae sp. CCMP2298]|nr:hypothetical protein B484DRAFT_394585 [Ochromonadaceae sp. CCMP2298]
MCSHLITYFPQDVPETLSPKRAPVGVGQLLAAVQIGAEIAAWNELTVLSPRRTLNPSRTRDLRSVANGELFSVMRLEFGVRRLRTFWRRTDVYAAPSGFLVPKHRGGDPTETVGNSMFGENPIYAGERTGEFIGDLCYREDYDDTDGEYGLLLDEDVVLDPRDYTQINLWGQHTCVTSMCNSTHLAFDRATGRAATTNMEIRAGAEDWTRMYMYCVKKTVKEFGVDYGDLFLFKPEKKDLKPSNRSKQPRAEGAKSIKKAKAARY